MEDSSVFQMRFPQKLWYLLNLRPDAILWGETGRTILLNYKILQDYLQSKHSVFKTTNISSFVRQLNLYGFRKVTSHLQDPLCNSSNPYMHEYIHDYFQYGRPELLNQISRKALNMKRNFKGKNLYNLGDKLCLTPLEKARHAFRMALVKAAQDFCMPPPKLIYNMQLDLDDSPDTNGEEDENIGEITTIQTNTETTPDPAVSESSKKENENTNKIRILNLKEISEKINSENSLDVDANKDNLMSFKNDSSQESVSSFSTQFLNMPDLDALPSDPQTGEGFLAEFTIDNDGSLHDGIDNFCEGRTLNCVLPSVSQEHDNDFVENVTNDTLDNEDWDDMFNDMMYKSETQESGSEFKQLYSQISKTIDLLNC